MNAEREESARHWLENHRDESISLTKQIGFTGFGLESQINSTYPGGLEAFLRDEDRLEREWDMCHV